MSLKYSEFISCLTIGDAVQDESSHGRNKQADISKVTSLTPKQIAILVTPHSFLSMILIELKFKRNTTLLLFIF